MKRFLPLLFLLTFFSQLDLFGQTSKKRITRTIKFIDLTETVNASFWGYYKQVPQLIMAAIESGSIKSFLIDYKNEAHEAMLTQDEYAIQKTFYNTYKDEQFNDFLFASDLPYLGLDQTISIVGGKECVHVHYVNLYSHENFSEDRKTREYRFSVKWEDFIAVLNQRRDVLYAPNIFGAWWRGNVFITNERYFIESKTSDFIELSNSYAIAPKDFSNLDVVKTVDSLGKKNYEPSMMDLYFIEEKKDNNWYIKRVVFGTVPQDQSYLNERRYGYEWTDFTTVLEKKQAAASSKIYTLAEAFLLKKFSYSDSIKSIQISKNGKFKNGQKDVLCSATLNESFSNTVNPISYKWFHTQLLESLYLEDTSNAQLNIPGHSLAEILYAHVLDGTLVACEDESLNRPMTVEKFRVNASQYLDVSAIKDGSIYEKGDTVSMYVNDGNYWYGETRYFIVQEKIDGAYFSNDSSIISQLKRYYPPLIPVEELNAIEFLQHLSFDSEGNNKKYALEVVALHVSADGPSNIKGIQYPICYVRWKDLKSVLLKDPRATFVYKGRQVSLIDVIENRDFLSILLKTGYVEIGE